MQKTRTLDFGIVLEGEIVLVLDTQEVAVKQGDFVVQRGRTTRGATGLRSLRSWRSRRMMAGSDRRNDLAAAWNEILRTYRLDEALGGRCSSARALTLTDAQRRRIADEARRLARRCGRPRRTRCERKPSSSATTCPRAKAWS